MRVGDRWTYLARDNPENATTMMGRRSVWSLVLVDVNKERCNSMVSNRTGCVG